MFVGWLSNCRGSDTLNQSITNWVNAIQLVSRLNVDQLRNFATRQERHRISKKFLFTDRFHGFFRRRVWYNLRWIKCTDIQSSSCFLLETTNTNELSGLSACALFGRHPPPTLNFTQLSRRLWSCERGLVVGRGTYDPEVPGSNPPPCHKMDLSSVAPNSTPPRCE